MSKRKQRNQQPCRKGRKFFLERKVNQRNKTMKQSVGGISVNPRDLLRNRYLNKCDSCVVEPCERALHWLATQQLDQPQITSSALSIKKKINVVTGTLVESDPIEPLLDVFQLIPLTHVSLEGCGLLAMQIEKLLNMFSAPNSRSQWSLQTLILNGNQVDSSVFPLLLAVVEQHHLLTLVKVDPSPRCHLYQLEQLCASNEAKCKSSFVQRKRGEANLSMSTLGHAAATASPSKKNSHSLVSPSQQRSQQGGKGNRHFPSRSPRVDGASSVSGTSASVASVDLVVAATSTSSGSYRVSICSFFSAIKTWLHFFYGPRKPLPDAMYYFIIAYVIDAIQRVSSEDELLEEFKCLEKRFVLWRQGNFVLPVDQTTLIPQVPEGFKPTTDVARTCSDTSAKLGASSLNCAFCDSAASFALNPEQQQGRRSSSKATSSLDATRKIFFYLLLESEGGSLCFVQDTSEYLLRVFRGIALRFIPSSEGQVPQRTESGDGSPEPPFLLPPFFCGNVDQCVKRFCRSIFCEAADFTHGVMPLERSVIYATEERRRTTAALVDVSGSRGCIIPSDCLAQSFPTTTTNTMLLFLNYKKEEGEREVSTVINSSPLSFHSDAFIAPCGSVLLTLKQLIERRIRNGSVTSNRLRDKLLSNLGNRLPLGGTSLIDVFHEVSLPNFEIDINVPLGETGSIRQATFSPTLVVQFAHTTNRPNQSTPFETIRDYFLAVKNKLNGSEVILGVKFRPDVFTALLQRRGTSQSKDHNPSDEPMCVLSAEKHEDSANRFGVPVAVIVTHVEHIGELWYLGALYQGEKVLLDERCVNKAVPKYGAFAFVDCSFETWLDATRKRKLQTSLHSPPSSNPFPLELLERPAYTEMALLAMLNISSFYSTPQSFASRALFRQGHEGKRVLDAVKDVLAAAKESIPLNVASDVTLHQLIHWYRVRSFGRIALYWAAECPTSFREVVATASRKLFAMNAFSNYHPSLYPVECAVPPSKNVFTTNATKSTMISSLFARHVPRAAPARGHIALSARYINIATSGVFLSPGIATTPSTAADAFNVLSTFGAVSLNEFRGSSAQSIHGNKRYLLFEFRHRRAVRLCELQLTLSFPQQESHAPAAVAQRSLVVNLCFSDDGVVFYNVPQSMLIEGVPEHQATGVPVRATLDFGNVGPHSHWLFYCTALNRSGQPIEETAAHIVYPLVHRVAWKYLPCIQDNVLLLEYNAASLIVSQSYGQDADGSESALLPVLKLFPEEKGVEDSPRHKDSETSAELQLPRRISPYIPCGFLVGASAALGGPPRAVIRSGERLFAFRKKFVVELTRSSGHVVVPAVATARHSIFSHLPSVLLDVLDGGFCFTGAPHLLFLHQSTHFCVFDMTQLKLVVPLTPFLEFPGRAIPELDAHGVAVNTQLITEGGTDPYDAFGFPFAEVEWLLPLRDAASRIATQEDPPQSLPSVISEVVACGFLNRVVRWKLVIGSSGDDVKRDDDPLPPAPVLPMDSIFPAPYCFGSSFIPTSALMRHSSSSLISVHKGDSSSVVSLVPDCVEIELIDGTTKRIEKCHDEFKQFFSSSSPAAGESVEVAPPCNLNETVTVGIASLVMCFPSEVSISTTEILSDIYGSTFSLSYAVHGSSLSAISWEEAATSTQDALGLTQLINPRRTISSSKWKLSPQQQSQTNYLAGRILKIVLSTETSSVCSDGKLHKHYSSLFDSSLQDLEPELEIAPVEGKRVVLANGDVCKVVVRMPHENARGMPLLVGARLTLLGIASHLREGFQNVLLYHEAPEANAKPIAEIPIPLGSPATHVPIAFPALLTNELYMCLEHSATQLTVEFTLALLTVPLRRIAVESTVNSSVSLVQSSLVDEPSRVPLHLRITPVDFVSRALSPKKKRVKERSPPRSDEGVAAEEANDETLLSSKKPASGVFLRREDRSYVITISNPSDRRRLVRLRAEVFTSVASVEVASQPVFLSFQRLSGEWEQVATTSVSREGIAEFFWGGVHADPQPARWRLFFLHDKLAVRRAEFFAIDVPLLSTVDGYSISNPSAGSSSLITFAFSASLRSSRSQLFPILIPHVGLERAPLLRIDIPNSSPHVGGVILLADAPTHYISDVNTQSAATSAGFCEVTAVLSSGEVKKLWAGQPNTIALWSPCHCTEIIVHNCTSVITGIRLLRGSDNDKSCGPDSDLDMIYSIAGNDVKLARMPAEIPFVEGGKVIVSSHDTEVPRLLFSAFHFWCNDSGVVLQVEYLRPSTNEYVAVAQLCSVAKERVTASWTPITEFPLSWRLVCVSLPEQELRSPSRTAKKLFTSTSFSFSMTLPLHRAIPVDFSQTTASVVTNAIARHNTTSQAALRQRSLIKMHSLNPSMAPYLRFSALSGSADDDGSQWEKKSQASSGTVASSASIPAFMFVTADLHVEPRSFTQLSIRAETDGEFELAVQHSDNNSDFSTVVIHRQSLGWATSTWPDAGPHRYWRLVVSTIALQSVVSKKMKRSQADSSFSDVSDEKYLTPFAISLTNCALTNICWFAVDTQLSKDVAMPLAARDLIALRRAQLADRSRVTRLNPLLFRSVPIGLSTGDKHREATSAAIDPVTNLSFFALWRSTYGRPVAAVLRAAAAAEEHLFQTLPHATNPHHVLEKDSCTDVSSTLLQDKEFEMNDVTVTSTVNRLTSDPSIQIRGSTLTGVRCIPPGTRVALCFEWFNTSLIPNQAVVTTRTILSMERQWLSLQSEFPSLDQFSRAFPVFRSSVFSDLAHYLTIYTLSKDPLRFGGNYPTVPLPSGTLQCPLPNNEFDIVAARGATILSHPVSLRSFVSMLANSSLKAIAPLAAIFFCSDLLLSIHAPFEGSVVRMDVTGTPDPSPLANESGHSQMVVTSLRFSISFDTATSSVTAELFGDVSFPLWFSRHSFFAHSSLFNETKEGDAWQLPSRISLAVVSADYTDFSESLFGPSAPLNVRNVNGVSTLRLSREDDGKFKATQESISFFGSIYFSRTWQVNCRFRPISVDGANSSPLLELSTEEFAATREDLFSYLSSQANNAATAVSDYTSPSIVVVTPVHNSVFAECFHSMSGRLHALIAPRCSIKPGVAPSEAFIEFAGSGTWKGSRALCEAKFRCSLSPVSLDGPAVLLEIVLVFRDGTTCRGIVGGMQLRNGKLSAVFTNDRALDIKASFNDADDILNTSNECANKPLCPSIRTKSIVFCLSTRNTLQPTLRWVYDIAMTPSSTNNVEIAFDALLQKQGGRSDFLWCLDPHVVCTGLEQLRNAMEDLLVEVSASDRFIARIDQVQPVWEIPLRLFSVRGSVSGTPFSFLVDCSTRDTSLIKSMFSAFIQQSSAKIVIDSAQ